MENDDVEFTEEDNKVEAGMDAFPIAPDGWYICMITGGDRKDNSKGTGAYLNLKIQIVEGEQKGTTIFDMLNLWNPSEKTVNIARARLNAYRKAVGKPVEKSMKNLFDIPFRAHVKIEKGTQGYRDKNVVVAAEGYVSSGQGKAKPTVPNNQSMNSTVADEEVPSFS